MLAKWLERHRFFILAVFPIDIEGLSSFWNLLTGQQNADQLTELTC